MDQDSGRERATTEGSTHRITSLLWDAGKAFAGIAAAMVAIMAALYIIAPHLKPREKLGADLDHVAVTQDVDFNEYQSMDGQRDDEPSGSSPPGVLVVAHATLKGYEDRNYLVCVTIMDADTMWTVSPPAGEMSLASCELKSPHALEEGVIWHC